MWVFTAISEERVSSSFNELLVGVLFLFIREKILSSPAFECGIVIMASATLKSKSNSNEFVPGFFTPRKKPHRRSTRYGCSSETSMCAFAYLGISASESNW